MARKKPTIQIEDGEWFTIAWKGQHEECCVCGLKHRLEFRVADGGKLQMRATRVR